MLETLSTTSAPPVTVTAFVPTFLSALAVAPEIVTDSEPTRPVKVGAPRAITVLPS